MATLLNGLLLLGLGAALLFAAGGAERGMKTFLRSKNAALVTLGLATAWFLLVHIRHLGAADFGEYRNFLFVAFLAVAIGAYFHVPDFLSVRGLAALILLAGGLFLNAAYAQEPVSRLFLVSFCYVAIIVAIYLAAVPYRLRDFSGWLFARPSRYKALGGAFLGYGILLCPLPTTY